MSGPDNSGSDSIEAVDSEELYQVLRRHDLEVTSEQAGRLARYATELWRWNTRVNLTRHTDIESFVSRDVLDSWQLTEYLTSGEEVLDVGSGGGVPGIVLAILRPDLEIVLCDSIAKKAKILNDLVCRLDLPLPVYAARAEELVEEFRFDTLVARAVGPLPKLAQWFQGRWHQFDRLLAIKGPRWTEERGEARHRGLMHGVRLRKLKSYRMPGTDSESVILQLSRQR